MKNFISTATLIFIATAQIVAMREAMPERNTNLRAANPIEPIVAYNERGQKMSEVLTDPYSQDPRKNTAIKYYSYRRDNHYPAADEIYLPNGSVVKTEYNDTTGIKLSQSLKNTDGTSATIIFAQDGQTPVQQNNYDANNNLTKKIHYKADGKSIKSKLTNNRNGSTMLSTYGLANKREQAVWTHPDNSRTEVNYWFDGIHPKNIKSFDVQGEETSNQFKLHPGLDSQAATHTQLTMNGNMGLSNALGPKAIRLISQPFDQSSIQEVA